MSPMPAMRRLLSRLATAALLCAPGSALALTLSADLDTGDCFGSGSDCVGGLYTLDVTQLDADTFSATLTMDFGSTNALYDLDVNRNLIMNVEFKVANTYFDPIVVTAAPGGDTSNWVSLAGPLNGNGCGGSNDGFICLDAGTDLLMGTAKTYSWTVEFNLASGDSLLAESDWHIGARFGRINPANGRLQTSLLSASAAPIPEPTSALLFAVGGLVVGAAARRRLA